MSDLASQAPTYALRAIERRIREASDLALRADIDQASKALSELCTEAGTIHTSLNAPGHSSELTADEVLAELKDALYAHHRERREAQAINAFMVQVSSLQHPAQTPSTKETK